MFVDFTPPPPLLINLNKRYTPTMLADAPCYRLLVMQVDLDRGIKFIHDIIESTSKRVFLIILDRTRREYAAEDGALYEITVEYHDGN